MKLKTLYIFNREIWPGLLDQAKQIDAVGLPYIEGEYETSTVSFQNIPFISDFTNTPNSYKVDKEWLKANILPLRAGYDVIFFHMPSDQWKGGDENGYTHTTTETGFDIPIVTIHSHQGELLWNNPTYNKPFYERGQHEKGHVICDILKVPDHTHLIEAQGNLWKQPWFDYLGLTKQAQISLLQTAINFLLAKVTALMNKRLVTAIIQVESGGDDNAYNPNDVTGPAYGCLQIHQGYLTDANGWLRTNYTLKDLLGNRDLSIKVFNAYMDRYATSKRLGRAVTDQDRARVHNGGPNGWNNPKTIDYWNKVQRYL